MALAINRRNFVYKFSHPPLLSLIFAGLIFFAGCNSSIQRLMDPNQYSQAFTPIQLDNVTELESVSSWQVAKTKIPISKLRYDVFQNRLAVVNDDTGTITILDAGSGYIYFQNTLNVNMFYTFDLDAMGSYLLGGIRAERVSGEITEYFDQIAIWNTNNGLMEKCVIGSCLEKSINETYEDETYLGASMDFNMENLVIFDEGAYSFRGYSRNKETISGFRIINNLDADYWRNIGDIAIDTSNDRFAIIFQEGDIQLDEIPDHEKTSLIPLNSSEVIKSGEENHLQKIQESIFDTNGNMLAVVRGDTLSVWSLEGKTKEQILTYEVGNIHDMGFDILGALLFVGVDDQIIIFGLKDKKVITRLQTPDISTLCISDDNRLLFWGDADNNIHVWGIKK